MISHVIPIGGACAYFVHTNLANIAETCGVDLGDFDLVFLTGKTISPQLQKAYKEASEKYKFRVVQAPFECDLNMSLVDWAMRNADLQDWVSLQHIDTFWRPNSIPWLKTIIDTVEENPNNIAISGYNCSHNLFNGREITGMTDFCGAYNRNQLIDKNLKFIWGRIDELNISAKTKFLIQDKRFTNRQLDSIKWLDGGELITLEIAAKYSKLVSKIELLPHLIHPWSLVRPLLTSTIKNNKIHFTWLSKSDFSVLKFNWAVMSLVSSCYFDVNNNKNILPWKFFSKYTGFTIQEMMKSDLFKVMSRYERPHKKNVIGLQNDMGIKNISFADYNPKIFI